MATGASFDKAVETAHRNPSLGVGCHVVLVDGCPATPAEKIRSLLASNGEFRPTLGRFVQALLLHRVHEENIEAEATAQIQRLQQAGIRVTHVDTHKHTHMFPAVLRPLLRAAQRCGVHAVRNPFEPDWALAATPDAPALRRLEVRILHILKTSFLRQIKQAGMITTNGAIGVLATGTLNAATLRRLLDAIPAGTWELVCHPGYNDAALATVRTRLRESRATEHSALLEAVPNHPRFEPLHFGALSSK